MEAGEYRALNGGDRAGVVAETVFATISAASVTLLLLHIFSVTTAPFFLKQKPNHNEERVFLRMQLGVFVVCLLLSDLCQAIGGLIQGSWAGSGLIRQGPACTAQGILIEFGDVGTAIWNLVVAMHNFITVVLGKRMSTGGVIGVVIGGWGLIVLLTTLGPIALVTPEKGPFYGVGTLRWCFIRDPYSFERLMVHYPPMFLSAFLIFVFYSMVFLTLRGNLIVDGWRWTFYWKQGVKSNNSEANQTNHLRSLAKKVLWYPVVYIALILPISVCRLAAVNPNSPAWAVAMCFLVSMGCANSLLYAFTRRIGPSPWLSGPVIQVFVSHVTQKDVGSSSSPASKENKPSVTPTSSSPLRSPVRNNFSWRSPNSSRHQAKPSSASTSDIPVLDIGFDVLDISKPEDSTSPVVGSIIIPDLGRPLRSELTNEGLDDKEDWDQSNKISRSSGTLVPKGKGGQG